LASAVICLSVTDRELFTVQCGAVNARTMVHRRTAERAGRFPDLDPRPLVCNGLPPRDAALARAIDHVISRRWLTLATVVDSRLTEQRWDSLNRSVQAALLVGSAQLLFLERIPDHAAIDQSVRWIKTTRRSRAAGLVNAVLRRIADLRGEIAEWRPVGEPIEAVPRDAILFSDGRALALAEPVFAANAVQRLVQQTSHSEPLIAHWMAAFDRKTAAELALHGLVQAPIILRGSLPTEPHDNHLHPHDETGFMVFSGERDELESILARHEDLYVQDPTTGRSMNLTRHVDPPPSVIIDYCAGKGTKTRQLAEMFPAARIIATDRDTHRFQTLRDALGSRGNVEVIPFRSVRDFVGCADLLVLDVPCSNTGVLARRAEARYRFTGKSLASLVTVQRQIFADALPLLKHDAWLLHTTCSVEPAENQQQVGWMTESLPLAQVEQQFVMPRGLPGDPPTSYHDGGFASLMRWQVE